MQCRASGCASPTSGRSHYCDKHKRNKVRHGHPSQASVSSLELKPYLRTVRARIKKNANNAVWQKLDNRWLTLVDTAQHHVELVRTGKPYVKYHREAWSDLARIGASVEPREVVETILAMYLMQEWMPKRFADDISFAFQLVRRVRSLDSVAVGSYYDHTLGKAKKVYRDMKPKTTQHLAAILAHTFGAAGLVVARLEAKDRQDQEAARIAFHDDLATLT